MSVHKPIEDKNYLYNSNALYFVILFSDARALLQTSSLNTSFSPDQDKITIKRPFGRA